jgi:hypothetical protein
MDLCVQVDTSFTKLEDDLRSLESYAVAIRYPGASVSAELAESAFGTAERVRDFIRKKLKIK